MSLMKKSFKELSEMVEEIADRFFTAKQAYYISQQGELLAESDSPCLFYIHKVEEAYQALDERERNLINNEFFFQNYHDWWIGLYSKTSFYRFKRNAMLKFLEVFYHD